MPKLILHPHQMGDVVCLLPPDPKLPPYPAFMLPWVGKMTFVTGVQLSEFLFKSNDSALESRSSIRVQCLGDTWLNPFKFVPVDPEKLREKQKEKKILEWIAEFPPRYLGQW